MKAYFNVYVDKTIKDKLPALLSFYGKKSISEFIETILVEYIQEMDRASAPIIEQKEIKLVKSPDSKEENILERIARQKREMEERMKKG